MSRSASTFTLSDSAKSSAVVQRSNSLDHPPLRPRVPVCVRTPCSPVHSLVPDTTPEVSLGLCPNSSQEGNTIFYVQATAQSDPTRSQQTTSSALPLAQNPRPPQHKTSQPVPRHAPSAGPQPRSVAPQPVNVKGRTFSESCRDPHNPLDPRGAVLCSPRRETLL